MNRILIVLPNLDHGGTEVTVMNYFRASGLPFDFAVHGEAGYFEPEAIAMGARIHRVPTRSQGLFKNIAAMRALYKKHPEYKTVIVCTEHSFAFIELWVAWRCGVKIRAAWSHFSDYQGASRLKRYAHFVTRPLMRAFGNRFLACSESAGKWLFGKTILRKKNFHIVKNAIDLDKYNFNPETRRQMRDRLGLGDHFTVGIVGRLAPVKNHAFALEVFARIAEKDASARFLVIGVGILQHEIAARATHLGISDKTTFIGTADNIHDYYQAMDAFIAPSLHEGFCMVALEAQAAGLPVLLSEGVPREAAVCDLAQHMNLSEGAQAWADAILKIKGNERKVMDLYATGFHITDAAKDLKRRLTDD
ncbi:MAG: glycosyltransferase [Defluviitaleaceae bacterium]|nr:glycosyltransferase [Defluviitaleaceae bacterium]